MKFRTIVAALIFGGCVVVGGSLLSRQFNAPTTMKMTDVVVSTQAVQKGTQLSQDMLKTVSYAADMVPAEAVTKIEDVIGRTAAVSVSMGVLLESHLVPQGAGSGLAALIPAGMVAFTINTPNVASGLAGLVQPDDHVDVLVTIDDMGRDNETGGGKTFTLLQNIQVLAVNQKLDPMTYPEKNGEANLKNPVKSVTLATTPTQVVRLGLGQSKGTLHLALRNPSQHSNPQVSETPSVTLNDLIGRRRQDGKKDEQADELQFEEAPVPSVEPETLVQLPPIVTYRGRYRGLVPLSPVRTSVSSQPEPVAYNVTR